MRQVQTKICQKCGREYEKPIVTSKKMWALRIYCSKSCANSVNAPKDRLANHIKEHGVWNKGKILPRGRANPQYLRIEKTCLVCGKTFDVQRRRKNTAFYCSHKCASVSEVRRKLMSDKLRGRNINPATCFQKGHPLFGHGRPVGIPAKNKKPEVYRNCLTCGKEFKVKTNCRVGKWCSNKCYGKYRDKGLSPEKMRIRVSLEYKEWRRTVYGRDNFTCVKCGVRGEKGNPVVLHAHHIKKFSDAPELRFSAENGQTLCKTCHSKTENYGNRKPRQSHVEVLA